MQRSDFYFDLPDALIAQAPLPERSGALMLHVDGADGRLADRRVIDLPDLLQPGDLLVLNDIKVIPARLHAAKASGGKVEILIERLLDDHRALAHVRASKAPKPGTRLIIDGGPELTMAARHEALFELHIDAPTSWMDELTAHGHMPLPPYIRRADTADDAERYQTVFAREPGAVAAPTAGLHLDTTLLDAIRQRGVEIAHTTLWVGAGTFQPVRVDNLSEHVMHAERVRVSAETVAAVSAARERGGRVVAVGTTVVRALEAAAAGGTLAPMDGDTRLFIKPGDRFRVVDALMTNFHLPESTLLMLVCAFGRYDTVMAAYRHAVAAQYRFFSYGDAMFLTPAPGVRP